MADNTNYKLTCSFCEKSQKEVKKLIAGAGVYICDECIELCNEIIAEEKEKDTDISSGFFTVPKPREIKSFLDDYVIGQERAKKLKLDTTNDYVDVITNFILGESDRSFLTPGDF